ncbi:MAG: ComF family protein [Gammaproteobacteria bacterium]
MPLYLPVLCRICHQYHHNQHAICQACIGVLDPLGPACHSCANPLPQAKPPICGACAVHPPAIDRIFTSYRYTEPLRTLLHAFKYEAALYLTSFLADLILQALENSSDTECLIPIPLHKQRIRARGFNQAAVLTQYLSKILNKPYSLQGCDKILPTVAQAGLNAKQRRTNLLHAFQAKNLSYQHVTLIDDLYTTGATANEVAKTLKKQAGVQRVDLWCCARAV